MKRKATEDRKKSKEGIEEHSKARRIENTKETTNSNSGTQITQTLSSPTSQQSEQIDIKKLNALRDKILNGINSIRAPEQLSKENKKNKELQGLSKEYRLALVLNDLKEYSKFDDVNNITNNFGNPIGHIIISGSINKDFINKFIEHGIRFDRTDKEGRNALHKLFAFQSNYKDLAVMVTIAKVCSQETLNYTNNGVKPIDLLKKGLEKNAKNKKKLSITTKEKNDILDQIANNKYKKLNEFEYNNSAPKHKIISLNNDICSLLDEDFVKIINEDEGFRKKFLTKLKKFSDLGGNVNHITKNGKTISHFIVNKIPGPGNEELKILHEHGIRFDEPNKNGVTALCKMFNYKTSNKNFRKNNSNTVINVFKIVSKEELETKIGGISALDHMKNKIGSKPDLKDIYSKLLEIAQNKTSISSNKTLDVAIATEKANYGTKLEDEFEQQNLPLKIKYPTIFALDSGKRITMGTDLFLEMLGENCSVSDYYENQE